MRLMQHMLPGLLSEPDYSGLFAPVAKVPEGAVLLKSFDLGIFTGALSGVIGGVASIVNAPGNNRTAQEIAQQATMQAELANQNAAAQRASQMAMLKYAAGAIVLGLTIYLILR